MIHKTLYIRLSQSYPENVEWVITDEQCQLIGTTRITSLSTLAKETQHVKIIVLIPTELLLLTAIDVPARNDRELRQAVPYALEDQLLQDIDDLHFAIYRPKNASMTYVAIIEKNLLKTWLDPLYEAHIYPDLVIPEALALPWQEKQWTAVTLQDYTIVRTANHLGFALENQLITSALHTQWNESTILPDSMRIYSFSDSPIDIIDPLNCEIIPNNGSLLALLATQGTIDNKLNLLQGSFKTTFPYQRFFKLWRPLGILIAAIILIGLLKQILMFLHFNWLENRLTQQIQTEYNKRFHETPDMTTVRTQLIKHIEQLQANRGDEGFLSLLNTVGQVIKSHRDVLIKTMQFHNHELQMEIDLESPLLLNTLIQQWQTVGLQTKVIHVITAKQKTTATIQFKERS